MMTLLIDITFITISVRLLKFDEYAMCPELFRVIYDVLELGKFGAGIPTPKLFTESS
jgi:hypothetical protein